MATIDFSKVDAAFQHLATDPQGQSHLQELFGTALARLKGGLPGLNDHEAQYVAASLLNQRVGAQSNIQHQGGTGTARVMHGFVIKTAVD
jgi:hypothetical protein